MKMTVRIEGTDDIARRLKKMGEALLFRAFMARTGPAPHAKRGGGEPRHGFGHHAQAVWQRRNTNRFRARDFR